MKVGTDSVLLAAWANLKSRTMRVLDIGTGSGLIALMMAQRTETAQIIAIDIEPLAIEEASLNFSQSAWSNRLNAQKIAVQDFDPSENFDCVISNPPFFEFNFHSIDAERSMARQQTELSFQDLLINSKRLMSAEASCHFVIPYFETENFIKLASDQNLSAYKLCYVKGNASAHYKRTLMSLSFEKKTLEEEELIIEISRHQYTEAYIDIVKDFYLNM